MTDSFGAFQPTPHAHVFLGRDHQRAERRTWAVIILCTIMMLAEIIGGALFGSLALIADGLHMSTHAGALLLAALAYTFARRYAYDRSFTFGTGKFGDLAGYSSAIVLAMIALLIAYEAVERLISPVPISFREAIPIAFLGLAVNVASAWLLSGGRDHDHYHNHAHVHDHHHEHDHEHAHDHHHEHDHAHGTHHRDNNMRAAVVHVMADAAVSVLVIVGLLLARAFGWLWMDPLAGLIGAVVIANWSFGLLRDTGAILLDRTPDLGIAEKVRQAVESEGDRVTDLHLWRLDRDISARSCRWLPRRPAKPHITGSGSQASPTCRTSRWRSSTRLRPTTEDDSDASQIFGDRPEILQRGAAFRPGRLQAAADMVLNEGLLGIRDRALDRPELLGDLHTGAALFDHLDDGFEVAVGAFQAFCDRGIRVTRHRRLLSSPEDRPDPPGRIAPQA